MSATLPKISVIIPSFQQAAFLPATLESIRLQRYPNTEVIVIDGGSTDGTINVIKANQDLVTYWVSEPDRGQSHAVNKGLSVATGDLVAWQNSDDLFFANAFWSVARLSRRHPEIDVWYSDAATVDSDGEIIDLLRYDKFSGLSLLVYGWNITNQATFFRRSLFKGEMLDEHLHYAMDADLYLRLAIAGAKFRHVSRCWGALRLHELTKTSEMGATRGRSEWSILKARYGSALTRRWTWVGPRSLKLLMGVRKASLSLLGANGLWFASRVLRRAIGRIYPHADSDR